MSVLVVNDEVSFNDLKQMLEVTDGNLATHLVSLEENGYIKVHKGFIGRKTNTTYSVTKKWRKGLFRTHRGIGKYDQRCPVNFFVLIL